MVVESGWTCSIFVSYEHVEQNRERFRNDAYDFVVH